MSLSPSVANASNQRVLRRTSRLKRSAESAASAPESSSGSVSSSGAKRQKDLGRSYASHRTQGTKTCTCSLCVTPETPKGKQVSKSAYYRHMVNQHGQSQFTDPQAPPNAPVASFPIIDDDDDSSRFTGDQTLRDPLPFVAPRSVNPVPSPVLREHVHHESSSSIINRHDPSQMMTKGDSASDDDDEFLGSESSDEEQQVPTVAAPLPPWTPPLSSSVPVLSPPRPPSLLDGPLYPNASSTLGAFLHDVLEVTSQFNLADRCATRLHQVFQQHVSPTIPSYLKTRSIIKEHMDQPHNYPACPDDCYVHDKVMGDITKNDFKQLRCPKCDKSLSDSKGRPYKVSATRTRVAPLPSFHIDGLW